MREGQRKLTAATKPTTREISPHDPHLTDMMIKPHGMRAQCHARS